MSGRNVGCRYGLELLDEHALLRVLLLQDYSSGRRDCTGGHAHPDGIWRPDNDWSCDSKGNYPGEAEGVEERLRGCGSSCHHHNCDLAMSYQYINGDVLLGRFQALVARYA